MKGLSTFPFGNDFDFEDARPKFAGDKQAFFFPSGRRHTRCSRDWSSDVCSSDLGDVIAYNSTGDLPDVEEVFGVLSAVLNGGDLQDLQTINVEVTKALAGREQSVKAALTQLDHFVGDLDTQKQQIVRALTELDRFSGALAKQTGTIATALNDLGPGLKVLADN